MAMAMRTMVVMMMTMLMLMAPLMLMMMMLKITTMRRFRLAPGATTDTSHVKSKRLSQHTAAQNVDSRLRA